MHLNEKLLLKVGQEAQNKKKLLQAAEHKVQKLREQLAAAERITNFNKQALLKLDQRVSANKYQKILEIYR